MCNATGKLFFFCYRYIFFKQKYFNMANVFLTYLLWATCGWFGIHHLYLGRVKHAIIWFVTLGGGFGCGWFRDLWRIPYYVRWRNGDKDLQIDHLNRMASGKKASCGLVRIFGMFLMGSLASVVLCGILPNYKKIDDEISAMAKIFYKTCTCILIVIGSSIGMQKNIYIKIKIYDLICIVLYMLVLTYGRLYTSNSL